MFRYRMGLTMRGVNHEHILFACSTQNFLVLKLVEINHICNQVVTLNYDMQSTLKLRLIFNL